MSFYRNRNHNHRKLALEPLEPRQLLSGPGENIGDGNIDANLIIIPDPVPETLFPDIINRVVMRDNDSSHDIYRAAGSGNIGFIEEQELFAQVVPQSHQEGPYGEVRSTFNVLDGTEFGPNRIHGEFRIDTTVDTDYIYRTGSNGDNSTYGYRAKSISTLEITGDGCIDIALGMTTLVTLRETNGSNYTDTRLESELQFRFLAIGGVSLKITVSNKDWRVDSIINGENVISATSVASVDINANAAFFQLTEGSISTSITSMDTMTGGIADAETTFDRIIGQGNFLASFNSTAINPLMFSSARMKGGNLTADNISSSTYTPTYGQPQQPTKANRNPPLIYVDPREESRTIPYLSSLTDSRKGGEDSMDRPPISDQTLADRLTYTVLRDLL